MALFNHYHGYTSTFLWSEKATVKFLQ